MALAATSALAQASGTLTHDGVAMPIRAVVAICDAEKPSILFHLLPLAPTAAEVALLQKNDTFWWLDKPTIDAKKWPTWAPRGSVTLAWPFEPQAVGDLSKAWCHVYAFGVGEQNSNLNLNFTCDELHATLAGKLKAGETVALVAKGQGELSDNRLAWDFKVTAKVLPALPQ